MGVHRDTRVQRRLTPSVQGTDFLASREKALIDDIKWGVEGPFRILLGKRPIQCPCFHALSPESAFSIRRIDSRQKCGRVFDFHNVRLYSFPVQMIDQDPLAQMRAMQKIPIGSCRNWCSAEEISDGSLPYFRSLGRRQLRWKRLLHRRRGTFRVRHWRDHILPLPPRPLMGWTACSPENGGLT